MSRITWCIRTLCTRPPTGGPKDASERKRVSIDATCCKQFVRRIRVRENTPAVSRASELDVEVERPRVRHCGGAQYCPTMVTVRGRDLFERPAQVLHEERHRPRD